MNYVVHYCKNKNCNNAFVAEDYTKVRDIPPHWRLCPDCCKELGIDYEKQRPWTNRTEKQKEFYKKFAGIGKQNIQKYKALNKK